MNVHKQNNRIAWATLTPMERNVYREMYRRARRSNPRTKDQNTVNRETIAGIVNRHVMRIWLDVGVQP